MASSRQQIIDALSKLSRHPAVLACWLEGADAHDRTDAYSDLDLWLDVQDGCEDKVLDEVKDMLDTVSPVILDEEFSHPHPQIRQRFYKLKNTSEYLIIDVCIQSHSRNFFFTKGHKDEQVRILFDKAKVIRFEALDEAAFSQALAERVHVLERKVALYQTWVRKELARGHFLEALHNYHTYILQPLVEVLRIRYEPTKRTFFLKDVSRDLPEDVVTTLEGLFAAKSIEDIDAKLPVATKLFRETVVVYRSNLDNEDAVR